MTLGLEGRFNILRQSPHDLSPSDPTPEILPGEEWVVPSRYNIRAVLDDGGLVLWNTYSGTLSIFKAPQREAIEVLLSRAGFSARPRGHVKYLLDRGFLVKRGTNEYRRIQVGFGQQQYRTDLLQFILLASEDCNFRCTYCYEDFARGTMIPSVRAGIKKHVEKRLHALKHLSVSWFGGEPLYGMEAIEDLAPFFLKVSEENSLDLACQMTTNGYLLTPDVAEKLLAWKIRVFQITLDGTPEDHDRSRPARTGEGTFWQIFENLKYMKNMAGDFVIDLRVNFDRRNLPGMEEFLDLVSREFSSDRRFRMRFRTVSRLGGPNDPQLEVCGADEGNHLELRLRDEARKRGLKLSEDIRQVHGLGAQVCYAARPYSFIIGATGKVMKCTVDLDRKDRNVVGRITEEGDLILDKDKFALWTEPVFESDGQCKKCVVLPVCQGAYCPIVRFDTGRSPCTPLRQTAKKELRAMASANEPLKSRRVEVSRDGYERQASQ
jgi:uncharacterized protein